MPNHIRYCPSCETYTLSETCKIDGTKTISRIPPKYSPEDKYGKYRREVKENEYKEKGFLG